MKKRKCIAMMTIIWIILSFFSCKNMEEESFLQMQENEDTKTIALRFISSWGGVDAKSETLQSLLEQFNNENEHIEIINESLFGEDFLPKIKTDFASGNNPDVFGLWPGSDIRALVKAGKVADLTVLMDENPQWKDNFKSSMWAYTTYDNKIYGLPFETIFEGLFINKDLFEKYNVPIPETYEELEYAVRVFKGNGIIPIAYNSLSEGTYLYQNLFALLAGKDITEKPMEENAGIYFKKAMEYMQGLYQMGAFPENAFTMTNHERNMLFQEKKAAMIVQGSWFIGNFEGENDTVDVIHFPYIPEGNAPPHTIIYGLGNGCFHISAETYEDPDKKDASIKLLKMLTSKESAVLFAKQTGMLSSVDIREMKVDYNRLTRRGQLLLNNGRQFVGPPDSFVDRTVWEEIITVQMPYVLEGEMEVDAFWNKAVQAGIISR